MIIVKLQGRLGNQMFQYALAKSLEKSGKKVKIDSSQLIYDNNKNELNIFPIDIEEATEEEVAHYGDCNKQFIHKVLRHTVGYKKSHYLEKGMEFHPEVFELDEKYLDGYWQTEKYFHNIEAEIRDIFRFPKDSEERNLRIREEMKKHCSVSVHIRRGDYQSKEVQRLYGNPCNEEYYRKAVEYFREKYENPHFFVFTNDKEWVKEQFAGIGDMIFVDWNDGSNSYRDMQLMSLCKHNIIANSSFSWWGAWLNQNPEKTVIAPKVWFEKIPTPDVWCEGWVRISGDER